MNRLFVCYLTFFNSSTSPELKEGRFFFVACYLLFTSFQFRCLKNCTLQPHLHHHHFWHHHHHHRHTAKYQLRPCPQHYLRISIYQHPERCMTHRWYLGEGDGGDDGGEFISQRRERKMKDGRAGVRGGSSQGTAERGGQGEEERSRETPATSDPLLSGNPTAFFHFSILHFFLEY